MKKVFFVLTIVVINIFAVCSALYSRTYSKKELIEKREKLINVSIKEANLGKYKLANKILKSGLDKFGGDERVYFYYGLYLFKDGRFKEAVKNLEKAIQLLDINVSAHYILGKSLWRLKRYGAAMAEMRRVKRRMANHTGVWIDMGDMESQLGNFKLARYYYQIGGRYHPDNFTLIKRLINCEKIIGISPASKVNYEEYLKYDDKNILVLKNLIKIYIYNHKFMKAGKLLKNIPKNDKDYIKFLLVILKGLKKYKKLLKISKNYLRKYPDNMEILKSLVIAHLNLKNYVKVIMISSRILKKEPDNVDILIARAFAMTNLGKFSKAKLLYEKALFYADDNFKENIKRNIELVNEILKEIKSKR